jgi:hypothetical protein
MQQFSIENYLSVEAAAKALGIIPRRIRALCASGRFQGAEKYKGVWIIPITANDPRMKRGRPKLFQQ